MTLSKEQINKADDFKTIEVPVPEWGGSVLVRTISGTERDAFEQTIFDGKSQSARLTNIRARLAALTMVDEKGKRLYEDKEIATLGRKSAKPLDRIYDAAAKLNGLSKDDVEDLAKNSETGPSDDSTSP